MGSWTIYLYLIFISYLLWFFLLLLISKILFILWPTSLYKIFYIINSSTQSFLDLWVMIHIGNECLVSYRFVLFVSLCSYLSSGTHSYDKHFIFIFIMAFINYIFNYEHLFVIFLCFIHYLVLSLLIYIRTKELLII